MRIIKHSDKKIKRVLPIFARRSLVVVFVFQTKLENQNTYEFTSVYVQTSIRSPDKLSETKQPTNLKLGTKIISWHRKIIARVEF